MDSSEISRLLGRASVLRNEAEDMRRACDLFERSVLPNGEESPVGMNEGVREAAVCMVDEAASLEARLATVLLKNRGWVVTAQGFENWPYE